VAVSIEVAAGRSCRSRDAQWWGTSGDGTWLWRLGGDVAMELVMDIVDIYGFFMDIYPLHK
jgi:hypothetical protein